MDTGSVTDHSCPSQHRWSTRKYSGIGFNFIVVPVTVVTDRPYRRKGVPRLCTPIQRYLCKPLLTATAEIIQQRGIKRVPLELHFRHTHALLFQAHPTEPIFRLIQGDCVQGVGYVYLPHMTFTAPMEHHTFH